MASWRVRFSFLILSALFVPIIPGIAQELVIIASFLLRLIMCLSYAKKHTFLWVRLDMHAQFCILGFFRLSTAPKSQECIQRQVLF